MEKEKLKNDYGFIDRYHFNRRREILAKHPEIRDLMIIDPQFKYVTIALTVTQTFIGYLLADAYLVNVIAMSVLVGSLFCCAITNAIHELAHDRAIEGSPLANKIFGTFINFGLGWPQLGGYYRTHRNHHAYLGSDLDAKYPSLEEAEPYDRNMWTRLHFIFRHPFSGGEHWVKHINEPPQPFEVWHFRAIWAFNILYTLLCGYKAYLYVFLSYYINDCIFIQGSKNFIDHWVDEKQAYAVSYYGWVNLINFNIGYHREHHDFPNIPARHLKTVHNIAKEYYSDPQFYETFLFAGVWRLLWAPPGKGLLKHANKLNRKSVELNDDKTT